MYFVFQNLTYIILSFSVVAFQGQPREHFAEADEVEGNASAGYYQCHGGYNHQYSAQYTRCQCFAEHRDADYYGRYGLQRSEDCRGSGPDILYGTRGAEE